MYYTEVSTIEIPFLHDATMVCEEIGHKLRSIYVDPNGECAISYWGDLSLIDRARVLQNYLPYDAPFEECYKMAQNKNYTRWFSECTAKHPNGYTQLYTPDGIDYRKLELHKI